MAAPPGRPPPPPPPAPRPAPRRAAAERAARYINDRHMPDKAIDGIDEAGAY
ncbi:hypothetical protein I5L26_14860, partial [Pseudomonas aeruginosa]|nr:hypothetical protein [Pseudomonas aeruginosa]